MNVNDPGNFLYYYNNELSYLRKMGSDFAQKYPRVASRLELGVDECADPHVERLLESFAFLTARLQRDLDGELPELTTALLGILYPTFVTPIPSLAIAQFTVDPKKVNLTTKHLIEKNTALFAQTPDELTCRFRTCYPVSLWPLEVTRANIESPASLLKKETPAEAVLRLELQNRGEIPLDKMRINKLRFYLHGERELTNALYELLFCNATGVKIEREDGSLVSLPKNSILPVGFGLEEDVLPFPKQAHPGYRLLHEYFSFSKKFRFFEIDNLTTYCPTGKTLKLLIPLNPKPLTNLAINQETFRLGCTPIINLFPKTTEPIRLDHRYTEYRLVGDMRREKTTEIHSIQKVSAKASVEDKSQTYEPFYSYNHAAKGRQQQAFWMARRVDTGRKDLPGTDVFLSFVDLDFSPKLPPEQTVYAHTLCTNRNLAEQLPPNALLHIDEAAPLHEIRCISDKPTSSRYPPLRGDTLWQLISHLSLNHLSFASGEDSLKALQEILRLYSFSDKPYHRDQIEGISRMASRRVIANVGQDLWRGFARGWELTLTFNESKFVGSGAFLLATVLNSFFALYAPINSFTQLVIRNHERELKKWPPMAGEKIIL